MIGITREQYITLRNLSRVGQTELQHPVTYQCASWAHPVVTLSRIGLTFRTKAGATYRDFVGYTPEGTEIPRCDISKEAAALIIEQLIKGLECHDQAEPNHKFDIMGFYIARSERMVMQIGREHPVYFDLNKARNATDCTGRKLFPTPFDFACHCIFAECDDDLIPYIRTI